MCGQPTAYNAYATLPYTNPLFMGFSRSQNVNKEIIFALAMCHATVNIKGFAHALHGAELFCIQLYRHVAVALKFRGVMIFSKSKAGNM